MPASLVAGDVISCFAEPDVRYLFSTLAQELPVGAVVSEEHGPIPLISTAATGSWAAAHRVVEEDSCERRATSGLAIVLFTDAAAAVVLRTVCRLRFGR